MKTRYVLGFAFNEQKYEILLISKLHPDWMKGFLNGIGGKIKDGETPEKAMSRECFEETGLSLDWTYKGFMEGINDNGGEFSCFIFYAYSNDIFNYEQREDEVLKTYNVSNILQSDIILNNLHWLLPFGRHERNKVFMTMNYRKKENL